jgi:hypothetical protein
MAYSSLMGADTAPTIPSGRGGDLLGPSDNSDSGSDAIGSGEIHGDSDSAGTGERGEASGAETKEGGDILPDRVVRIGGIDGGPGGSPDSSPGTWGDDEVFTDLDEDAIAEDSLEALGEQAAGDVERDQRARRGNDLQTRGSAPDSEPGRGRGTSVT